MTDVPIEPWMLRLHEASAAMLAQMPAELVEECRALQALDPDGFQGLRSHLEDEGEWFRVSWMGRMLGAVSRTWLVTGELPDDPHPLDNETDG